jgi:general secretion pathway protein E/type IV pilus assembly protein PilB
MDNSFARKAKEGDLDIEHLIESKKIRLLKDSAFHTFSQGNTSINEVYPLLATT